MSGQFLETAAEDNNATMILEALQQDRKEFVPKEVRLENVQKRLEELLSKQNLAEDAYIQQHMNAQMYIPLAVLARHHSLCILGDEAAIISLAQEAAQRTDKFGIDEDGIMVRPLLKPRRNTLVLHGLPEVFPEDELKDLFNSSPECDSFCSIKPEVNNTAFVSFKTDEAAQNAALWLRSQKLQGAEIKCAIKSEHFVRSFFPASPGPSMQACSPYLSPMQLEAWGYSPWMPVHGAWPEQISDPASMGWTDSGAWGPLNGMTMGSQGSLPMDMKGEGKGKSPKGKGKGRKRGALGGSFSQDSQMESNSDYASPHLHSGLEPEAGTEGLAEPGYNHEYRKYSRQQIIEVCNAMEEMAKPESYERCESNDVALFRSAPCKDWAPLPTPMTTFASSFFGDDRRSSDAPEADPQKPPAERTGSKTGWGPKGRSSKPEGQDQEEADWTQGGTSWWSGGDSNRFSKGWNESKSWDAGYSQPHWVKKDEKKEEAEKDESSGPRKMSWADKVRGTDQAERAQRWVAKGKASEDTQNKEEDSGGKAAGESAAAASAAEANTAAAEATPGTAAAASASPSWADKVRNAAASGK